MPGWLRGAQTSHDLCCQTAQTFLCCQTAQTLLIQHHKPISNGIIIAGLLRGGCYVSATNAGTRSSSQTGWILIPGATSDCILVVDECVTYIEILHAGRIETLQGKRTACGPLPGCCSMLQLRHPLTCKLTTSSSRKFVAVAYQSMTISAASAAAPESPKVVRHTVAFVLHSLQA